MKDVLGVATDVTGPALGGVDDRVLNVSIAHGFDAMWTDLIMVRHPFVPSDISLSILPGLLSVHYRLRSPLHCHVSASHSTGQLSPAMAHSLIRAASSWNLICGKTLIKSLPVYSSCELYPIHTPLIVLLHVLIGYILPGALAKMMRISI
jgi:hypothetical protein